MASRIWINLGLLISILIAIFILQLDNDQDNKAQIIKLTDVDADTIEQITILREGQLKMQFKQQAGQWFLLHPYKAPAHPTRIDSMLGLLNTPSTHQLNIEQINLQELGLEQPETSILLNDLEIDFGTTHPLDNSRYVRIGNTVFTIADHIIHQLNTNPSFFINPKVIVDSDNIKSITTPNYSLKWLNGNWQLDPDISNDTVTSNTVINGWQQLEAQSARPFDGDVNQADVTIEYRDDQQVQYSIVENEGLSLINLETRIQYPISDLMRSIIFPTTNTTTP